MVVGCGGNDDVRQGQRLGKSEYLSELTSVARDLQAAIGASVDSNFTSPGPDELADITDVSAERVEALRPPEDVDECTSD